MSQPLKLEKVGFSYPDKELFRGVDFTLAPGEVVAITGASGCGKSTLARIIAGHIRPTAGQVKLGDRVINGRPGRSVFLVSQENDLFPWLTAAGHLDFVARLGVNHGTVKLDPESALRMVRLGREGGAYPKALSGGMQKRLALARALVLDPAVLLLDETFSPLDEALRQELWADLAPYWKQRGTTVVLVSHDSSMLRDWGCRALPLAANSIRG
jgi:ABC-type nitrate/sulfonate/bicarbonate transport system ATPase subunit